MLDKSKKIDVWTIYVWYDGDVCHGAAPVVTKDGIKAIYKTAWELFPEPDTKRNERRHQEFRAKARVKAQLNNTLNALNWYGKQVCDAQGNIDPAKFQFLEKKAAANSKVNGIWIGIEKTKPFKKYPVKEITSYEALKNKFI